MLFSILTTVDPNFIDRLLMNNVNSISQMNSMVCQHSSLMGHEAKKGAMMGGEKGPDGKFCQCYVVPRKQINPDPFK